MKTIEAECIHCPCFPSSFESFRVFGRATLPPLSNHATMLFLIFGLGHRFAAVWVRVRAAFGDG